MGYRTIGLKDLDDPLGTIGGLECRDFPEAGFFLRVCAMPMEESGSAYTMIVFNGDVPTGFVSVIPRGSDAAAVFGVRDPWEREDVGAILSILETETEGFGTVSLECPAVWMWISSPWASSPTRSTRQRRGWSAGIDVERVIRAFPSQRCPSPSEDVSSPTRRFPPRTIGRSRGTDQSGCVTNVTGRHPFTSRCGMSRRSNPMQLRIEGRIERPANQPNPTLLRMTTTGRP